MILFFFHRVTHDLVKLPPELYTRNLLWAARASELKQFDDMGTFTFQKDTFYIHTTVKTDREKLVRLVGTWNLRMICKKHFTKRFAFYDVFIGPISGAGIRNT